MKFLFKYQRALLFGLVFAAFLYFIVFRKKTAPLPSQAVVPTTHLGLRVTAPVQSFFGGIADSIAGSYRGYLANRKAMEENVALRSQLAQLKTERRNYEETRRENLRLLKLLGLSEHSVGVRYLPARVIATSPSPLFQSIRIDRGTQDGLQVGMGIMAGEGVVGRIRAIDKRYSDVALLTDASSNIDVMIGSTRARGRLRGIGDSTGYRARVDYVTRTDRVEVGDTIVTTGAGTVFPKGLMVGFVKGLNRLEHGLYQDILVEPATPLAVLEEVLVVIGFDAQSAVTPFQYEDRYIEEYFKMQKFEEDPLIFTLEQKALESAAHKKPKPH